MNANTLDLSNLVGERSTVILPGGKSYEMISPGELSPSALFTLSSAQERISAAESDQDFERIAGLLQDVIKAVLVGITDEEAAALPMPILDRIIRFFSAKLAEWNDLIPSSDESPESSGSTAAT